MNRKYQGSALTTYMTADFRQVGKAFGGRRPPLQVSAKSRGFLCLARFHFRTPAKFFQQRIRFAFDCVGDDFTQHRRELKSMAAVAGRNGQSGTLRIASDPKNSIMGIAIETDAREYNWGIRQRRKGVGQKMAQLVFLLFRYDAFGRIWRHLASGPVIRDFHHAVAIEGETVIASSRNICAENRKTFRAEKFGLFGSEMKN